MKFLLALLALTSFRREMIAVHNAYSTLHELGLYGVVMTCEEIQDPFFRCTDEARNIRMYCPYLQGYKCQIFKIPDPVASEPDSAGL